MQYYFTATKYIQKLAYNPIALCSYEIPSSMSFPNIPIYPSWRRGRQSIGTIQRLAEQRPVGGGWRSSSRQDGGRRRRGRGRTPTGIPPSPHPAAGDLRRGGGWARKGRGRRCCRGELGQQPAGATAGGDLARREPNNGGQRGGGAEESRGGGGEESRADGLGLPVRFFWLFGWKGERDREIARGGAGRTHELPPCQTKPAIGN